MSISQGDTILHPQHGVGLIKSIRRVSFSGEEPRKFAKLFFKRDKLTVMMRPDDLDETVRSIISAAEARKVLKHLESNDSEMSSHWKTRAKKNEAAIAGGDPYDLATIYKGLSRMQQSGQSLRAADRKHMQTSMDFLSEELAAALGKSQAQVEKMIHDRCQLPEKQD
ncbi:MAG: CarD family transcriptional regulator [Xanthomonadales bacterium]|nr:CarD family transcriptional regulator [Xanthomonadales bacterium]